MGKTWWDDLASQEREARGVENYQRYGKEDVVLIGYPEYNPSYDLERDAVYYSTTADTLRVAYDLGRQEAEQEKQRTPAAFYLRHLLKLMERGDEWYGTDFEQPMWIVKQALAAMQESEQVDETIQ